MLHRLHTACLYLFESFHNQTCACLRQLVMKGVSRLVGCDLHLALKQHIPGVQPLVHLHNRNARYFFSVDDGPLDRPRSPVFGQKRCVDIHTAVLWHGKNLFRENLPESRHHKDIRLITAKRFHRLRLLYFHRLKNRNTVLLRAHLYGCLLHFFPSALRLIRLGHHRRHLMSGLYDRFQRTHRKIRRSHKHHFHLSIALLSGPRDISAVSRPVSPAGIIPRRPADPLY